MNKRLIYALPATVLALVALGLATMGLLSTESQSDTASQRPVAEAEQVPEKPQYRYLVAREALSPGDIMEEGGFVSVSSEAPVPDAVPADDAPFGQPIKASLAAGQTLTEANMRTDSVLDALVPQDHKAMAVSVDEVAGVGGLLRPGDRVDVTASFRRADNERPAALQLLSDVLVLAVRGVPYNGEGGENNDPRRNNTVVLSVPEEQVSRLLLASTEGSVRLVAVSPRQVGSEQPEKDSSTVKAVYLEDLFPAPPKPAPARRAAPPPSTRVQVFEGTQSRSVYVR